MMGAPKIINTDQGSQFTAQEFVDVVLNSGAKLSMDGRGAWRDNVFVERVWRSVKYECVYLKAYESLSQARSEIARNSYWSNNEPGDSSLQGRPPNEAWASGLHFIWKLLKMRQAVRPESTTIKAESSAPFNHLCHNYLSGFNCSNQSSYLSLISSSCSALQVTP